MRIMYDCGFTEAVLAENAGVTLWQLHFDVDAILRAYAAIQPLAAALGVKPPRPRLGGFAYPHVAALGAPVEFPDDGEPKVFPIIQTPEDIDRLREPDDYLAAPLIQQRLALSEELCRRNHDARPFIGHPLEGPITTAVLLMGQDFLTLPYDDPARAHRLLDFCVKSAVHYGHRIHQRLHGQPRPAGALGIPDDFAGMLPPGLFGEFVVPYWNQLYEGFKASNRFLHSELLREAHLPFLRDARIDIYDPSADQYLTAEILQRACPCQFDIQIMSWHLDDMSADQLEKRCREIADCGARRIFFFVNKLSQVPKIKRLLAVVRELAGETRG